MMTSSHMCFPTHRPHIVFEVVRHCRTFLTSFWAPAASKLGLSHWPADFPGDQQLLTRATSGSAHVPGCLDEDADCLHRKPCNDARVMWDVYIEQPLSCDTYHAQ